VRIGGVSDFIVDIAKGVIDAGAKQIANPKKDDKKSDTKQAQPAAQPAAQGQDIKAQTTMEVIVIGIGIYLLLEATR